MNFYHRFIANAAALQAPLTNLLKGSKKKNDCNQILWNEECHNAFSACKEALAKAACLTFPDSSAKLVLNTDASATAIGAVLYQIRDNDLKEQLGFFSSKLTPTQVKYSTYDRELLAIYSAIKYFRHLIEARVFTVFTDHQ